MPAFAARPGATSPGVNKIRPRDARWKESPLGADSVRRDSLYGTTIKDAKSTDTENRSASRSLALLKERVSRLGGGGGGTGLGDGYQSSPREPPEAAKPQQTPRTSLGNPPPRLVRQASQNATKSRLHSAQSRDLEMQENEDSPGVVRSPGIYSPHVLGAYNWVKEVEAANRQEAAALAETPKPAMERSRLSLSNGTTPDSIATPRLSLPLTTYIGQRDSKAAGLLKGRQQVGSELEAVGSVGGGVGTRIMVYVRLRPMAKKEKEAGSRSCVRIVNKRDVYLTEFALETDYLRLKRVRGRHFAFDASFPDNTSQQEVYNTSTAELVEGVLQGRNGSVFCYGATGAGKTHTMLGTVQSPGVMVLALKDLFAKIKQRSKDGDHVVRLSYLEVYNESVRDLLSPGRPLVLREDTKQGIVAAGLTQYQAYSADEVMTLLQRGNLNRTTEPTRANETSSRSHAILQVVAEYKVQQETSTVVRAGKLSLIDLAGSERALATDQRTLRSVEGASINRSLLALSSCINALCEGKKHIPFRNSKLTQLLKDSLGGSCRTAMIANISPSNGSFGETQNTLHWADRAKEIRTKSSEAHEELDVPETVEDKAKLLTDMQKENQQLRLQLARLHQKFVLAQQGCAAATAASRGIITPGGHESRVEQMQESPITPQTVTSPPFQQTMRLSAEDLAQGKTPGLHSSLSEQEFPERVTAERTIRDLQRTIQLLEMEAERAKQEIVRRDKKHSATMAQLQQEHALELKQKDEIIQKLCQRPAHDAAHSPMSVSTKHLLTASGEPPSAAATTTHTISRLSISTEPTSRHPIAVETIFTAPVATPPRSPMTTSASTKAKRPDVSPIKPVSRVPLSLQGTAAAAAAPAKPFSSYSKIDQKRPDPSPRLPAITEKAMTPRMGLRPVRYTSNKIPALPPVRQPTKETRPRVVDPAPRRLSISQHPPRSPPLPRFCSPSKPGTHLPRSLPGCCTRKRSFWDITNTNSPSAVAPVARAARRLSTAPTNTPSLLLQPGFSRRQSHG